MLQQINKHKLYFYLSSFLLLSTITNTNLKNLIGNYFMIKNINIKNDNLEIKKKIYSKTKYLKDENIFKIEKSILYSKLKELNYLENIIIKKNYPSTLLITATETDLIAITYKEKKKYFIGKNKEFINSKKIKTKKELPIIFGKFDVSNFLHLQDLIKKHNLNYKKINKYYFHKNKRWDLYLENNILIMLPNKNVRDALKLYIKFNEKNEIKSDAIIDLRIENRLILNNG